MVWMMKFDLNKEKKKKGDRKDGSGATEKTHGER